MQTATSDYTFRTVASEDSKLLSMWLTEPMVSRWYEDPECFDDLKERPEDGRIRMQLVLYDDAPIAFIQDYDIHAWPNHHLSYLPSGSRGIDTFIGSDKLIGMGHGTKYLSKLTSHLFLDGVPALGIDPHPENVLARHVYQKIGFKEDGAVESEWGSVMTMSLFSPQSK